MESLSLDPLHFFDHDFAGVNYDDYPSRFCTLQNENLFPRSKCLMLHDRNNPAANRVFEKIEPALLLASRMILHCPRAYAIFIDPETQVDSDSELKLRDDEVISSIKRAIPDIDFDTNSGEVSAFAVSTLQPAQKSDVITIDYDIILLLQTTIHGSDSQRLAGLFFLATLIAHGLAHILEFRYARQGRVQSSETSFQTPPALTCREASTSWESRVFGGRVYPMCYPGHGLSNLYGLCLRSSSWNFKYMKISPCWIRQLFSESHWTTVEIPLHPPIDKYAQLALIEDELTANLLDLSKISTPIKKRNCEVELSSGSPRRKNRQTVIKPLRICGGKVVQRA